MGVLRLENPRHVHVARVDQEAAPARSDRRFERSRVSTPMCWGDGSSVCRNGRGLDPGLGVSGCADRARRRAGLSRYAGLSVVADGCVVCRRRGRPARHREGRRRGHRDADRELCCLLSGIVAGAEGSGVLVDARGPRRCVERRPADLGSRSLATACVDHVDVGCAGGEVVLRGTGRGRGVGIAMQIASVLPVVGDCGERRGERCAVSGVPMDAPSPRRCAERRPGGLGCVDHVGERQACSGWSVQARVDRSRAEPRPRAAPVCGAPP